MIVLLGLYYRWPLVGGDADYDRKLFIAAPMLLILGAAALFWIHRALPYVRGREGWSWWGLPAPPGVVVTAAFVALALPPAGFDEARPRLEEIALEIIAAPGSTRSGLDVGGIDISRVEQRSGGAVYFIESDTSFGTTHGWIYSPTGNPGEQRNFISLRHIDGSWYEFEYAT
ncbi:hypothetical protein ERC79_05555 [Rhodococcus sp. ABRD24]|uniref:hypothetical protein n=1 Tax=Rhodococcus sp. ABRD24 TaxID=2507582 RepID=UPI00103B2321|nr:hypothetical protein [Rhodococcus sp. ABRD24]QBJ95484.1 hypothetical protein ERC79_05555 [Rhodococcus sp. ABRD24]